MTSQEDALLSPADTASPATIHVLYAYAYYYPGGGIDDLVFVGSHAACIAKMNKADVVGVDRYDVVEIDAHRNRARTVCSADFVYINGQHTVRARALGKRELGWQEYGAPTDTVSTDGSEIGPPGNRTQP